MKLRRFTSAGVEMARQYLAAVKESNDVEKVTLNGQPFTRAALISSPAYSDAIIAVRRLRLGGTPRPTPTWRAAILAAHPPTTHPPTNQLLASPRAADLVYLFRFVWKNLAT